MRIGLLGGTFDPVHLGHLLVAQEAQEQLGLDLVIFMPAGRPWLRQEEPLTAAEHRFNMVALAVGETTGFKVARHEIDRPGTTYTVDTLRELKRELGEGVELYFILGPDALEHFHMWKEPESLLALAQLALVRRPGHLNLEASAFFARYPKAADRLELLETPLIGISGSDIRRRVAEGRSIRHLVPNPVARYIREHGLYGAGPGSTTGLEPDGGPERRATGLEAMGQTVHRLLELALDKGALKYGEFTLSSGKRSTYYFDGRRLSLDPEGAHLIGKALLPIVRQAGAEAVGGPTLGADPIIAAVILAGYLEGDRIAGFIVRAEAKGHGTAQSIEGPFAPGSRVAIVDDVCTTGGSLLHAIAAAEAAGCTVVKVVVLLDRREGGSEELRRRGYSFASLMTATPEGRIEVVL